MLVLEPDKSRGGFFGLLPATAAPFFRHDNLGIELLKCGFIGYIVKATVQNVTVYVVFSTRSPDNLYS